MFQPQAIDPLLKQSIGHFLKALEDPDMNVRRVALVAFNSAAHNKPSLVRDLLDSVLPKLYAETNIKVSFGRCFFKSCENFFDRQIILVLFNNIA